ncbi:alpha/beta hydrolase [Actinosynnema sp.]|uniref:alpha/beta hydrolase n=1 Tax=Actinosynnema sp. TaxID=1872144 RepID=UPI003F848EB7
MGKSIAALAALLVLVAPGGGGREVRRVEVLGDLASAAHVAVVVPGSDVTEAGFDRTVGAMARAVRAEADRPDLAVVAWLGYETPSGVGVDAASGRLARTGARALADHVATLPGRVHLLCHSYGTVVCGLAARELAGRGVPVADVALTGSPGVRAGSAAELGAGTRVWAGRADADWIGRVPNTRLLDLGHGPDPADPEFGARALPTGGVTAHDGYYAPGTESLRALARVAVGERP